MKWWVLNIIPTNNIYKAKNVGYDMTQVNAVLRKTGNWRKIFHDAYIF